MSHLKKADEMEEDDFLSDLLQEVINRPNIDWQEQIHRGILRGLRNISETP
jgi:hypothetical protein